MALAEIPIQFFVGCTLPSLFALNAVQLKIAPMNQRDLVYEQRRLQALQRRLAALAQLPLELVQRSEDLQVVHYTRVVAPKIPGPIATRSA